MESKVKETLNDAYLSKHDDPLIQSLDPPHKLKKKAFKAKFFSIVFQN